MEHKTREEWLLAAVELFRPWFDVCRNPLPPKVYVSVGFAHNKAMETLGVCYKDANIDKPSHVFISPTLNDDHQVLSTLLHELCHAVLPPEVQHGNEFAELAGSLGLTAPWRSTGTSDALLERIKEVSSKLGKYPHAQLVPYQKPKQERKKSVLKVKCSECEYEARVNKKFLDEKGPPLCPDHNSMSIVEEETETETGEGEEE